MKITKQQAAAELSRRHLIYFARSVAPRLSLEGFHDKYYSVLDRFAKGDIRRLIITIPPQHGKSQGASIILPAYLLGLDPSLKIAVASYNLSLASKFCRGIRQIVGGKEYGAIFPGTRLPDRESRNAGLVSTGSRFDIAGHGGEMIAVGREGPLTGNAVDVFILDDLYKDAMEANSPVIRDNCMEWYNSVVKTRLHNESRELIVFTRWHEEDLIGFIEKKEKVVELIDINNPQTNNLEPGFWYKLNFEAIKRSPPTLLDPRTEGEALWPQRHSAQLLESKRLLDPAVFESMYQGNPSSREELLYGNNFRVYGKLPGDIIRSGNYTDTADAGGDYLCSVCYLVGTDGMIYITDLIYTGEGMDVTEPLVARMLTDHNISLARVESNNGGKGFARSVARLAPGVKVEWFHQSRNKEARILSNATGLLRRILFPEGWESRWPHLHADLVSYRRLYRANRLHDAPDVLTGIIETECDLIRERNIKAVGFG